MGQRAGGSMATGTAAFDFEGVRPYAGSRLSDAERATPLRNCPGKRLVLAREARNERLRSAGAKAQ